MDDAIGQVTISRDLVQGITKGKWYQKSIKPSGDTHKWCLSGDEAVCAVYGSCICGTKNFLSWWYCGLITAFQAR